MLWVLGLLLAFAGLCVWLEFGCMFPRSGGEKVYLEAVYQRPRLLATIVFSTQAILLGFTGEQRTESILCLFCHEFLNSMGTMTRHMENSSLKW